VDAFFAIMDRIDAADDERDLRQLKSRRLEKLKGDRDGQHSMRLNDQWRLILEMVKDEQGKYLLIIDIDDYH
jgi:toxin HigB-1